MEAETARGRGQRGQYRGPWKKISNYMYKIKDEKTKSYWKKLPMINGYRFRIYICRTF